MSISQSLKRYEAQTYDPKIDRSANGHYEPTQGEFVFSQLYSDVKVCYSLLPAPVNHNGRASSSEESTERAGPSASLIKKLKDHSTRIPSYGDREDWVPRTAEDFGDGGAFPEVHVAQFPLEMGRNAHQRAQASRSSNALVPLTTDAQGRTRYDAIVRQGHEAGAVVHTRPSALVGRRYSEEEMERPDEKEIADTVERTRRAMKEKLASVLVSTNASRAPSENGASPSEARLVRYTAASSGASDASGASQRLVKIVEKRLDPLEPPKFRIQKSAQLDEAEAPVPVLQDAPKKLTRDEANAWAIPTPFSNWNSGGFTIGLDKREMAAQLDREEVQISSKFPAMAAALDAAQQSAREQVAYRARLEQQKQLQQRELEEQQAREIARQARDKRSGIRAEAEFNETEDETQARLARDAMRSEMRRDIVDDARRERMGSKAKATAAPVRPSHSSGERDISERIALGQTVPQAQGEALFDSRLFNQTQGLDHGFVNDEDYNLYDRPLLQTGREEALFKGVGQREGEVFQEEFSIDRFKDNRGSRQGARSASGPVEFEKDEEAAHQQRMEEIERQKSMADRMPSNASDRAPRGGESPPRRRGPDYRDDRRDQDSPPRRGERYPSPPSRRRYDDRPRSDYPSPPRRGDQGGRYPSPPRHRDDEGRYGEREGPRGSSGRAPAPEDPMDSMLSFMSDAKSSASRKRGREDDGRGPTLGHMHAVGGSSGTAEDYRDSKRSKVNFVPTREAEQPHALAEDQRRADVDAERNFGERRFDRSRGDRYPPSNDSRKPQHDEFGRDRR